MSELVAIFLIVLYCISSNSVVADCPDGFLTHGQSCYHFSHDTETWLDAVDACEKLYDAYLVEIENNDENRFLINEANRLKSSFWTGGNDIQLEGTWKWFSSKTDVTFSNWGSGNPSNTNGDENCIEIQYSVTLSRSMWNDNICHKFQRYICEKPVAETEVIG